jgi:hypothetical protein
VTALILQHFAPLVHWFALTRHAAVRHTARGKEDSAMRWSDEVPTIHYTELPTPSGDGPVAREAATFHRELPRLLAEGHEGKWALIKGDAVIGVHDSLDAGERAGRAHDLLQPVLVQPVREWQPLWPARRGASD